MDALFGLPRKKSAGKSFRSALHGHIFLVSQPCVDEFVESSRTERKPTKQVIKLGTYRVHPVCIMCSVNNYCVGVQ